ncbi:NAD-binding protein [Phycicoccus sp. CSK15P-2]|uniref:potassium channel family protein n=1 Tax=Phycicoccus sp. CSK15P-2 TaxID=2807627 RepID=UPI00194FDBD8|nr:NAD(P)-binding protein [Phycicoccus sp. CSK15P-2]MBM6405341.1 NAD-binding protein [Phycicoccus sp. CSK15P-2]
MTPQRVLVVGDLEATRLVCTLLSEEGAEVVHLLGPEESGLRAALATPVDGVAVVVRGDLLALRFALLVEHLQPGVRLVVTIFDRTLGTHLAEVVPHCTVTSPADVAAPAVVAACVRPEALAVLASPGGVQELVEGPDGVVLRDARREPEGWGRRLRRWVPRRYGGAEGILLLGLSGLLATIALEWVLAAAVLHEGLVEGFYTSARLVATVGPAEAELHEAPSWYLGVSGALMLVGIAFTGALVAGLVEWIVGARTAALVGPRRVPTADHVVVAGLGQVGLRVAQLLRELRVPVVVVERQEHSPNLGVARQSRIPVVVGDASSRALLTRVGVHRARAVAAMGSDDLDNVAVAINALAVAPEVRTVLRAGEGAAVTETTSLFRIGQVSDVGMMTAAWVCASVLGRAPRVVWAQAQQVSVLDDDDGDDHRPVASRCACL